MSPDAARARVCGSRRTPATVEESTFCRLARWHPAVPLVERKYHASTPSRSTRSAPAHQRENPERLAVRDRHSAIARPVRWARCQQSGRHSTTRRARSPSRENTDLPIPLERAARPPVHEPLRRGAERHRSLVAQQWDSGTSLENAAARGCREDVTIASFALEAAAAPRRPRARGRTYTPRPSTDHLRGVCSCVRPYSKPREVYWPWRRGVTAPVPSGWRDVLRGSAGSRGRRKDAANDGFELDPVADHDVP